jgi:hypothetical protein
MSSDPMKMPSKYCHLRCTTSQMSQHSPMVDSFFSQLLTSSKKGITNFDALIACAETSVRITSAQNDQLRTLLMA